MKEELRKLLHATSIKIDTEECYKKLIEIEVRQKEEELRTIDAKKITTTTQIKRKEVIEVLKKAHRAIEKKQKVIEIGKVNFKGLEKRVIAECTHPICYNVGFFKGNNPRREVSIEEANFRIDKCLECGKELFHYRDNLRKRNPNWHLTPYYCIGSDPLVSFEILQKVYQDKYIDNPEAEAIGRVEGHIKNKQRIYKLW